MQDRMQTISPAWRTGMAFELTRGATMTIESDKIMYVGCVTIHEVYQEYLQSIKSNKYGGRREVEYTGRWT
jgi:hypothetical protein